MSKRRGWEKMQGQRRGINGAKSEKKKEKRLGQWVLWHSISCLSISKGSIAKQLRVTTFLSMLKQLHVYRSTITASAALSTGYCSLGWQLIMIFKQRKIKENPMQNLLHLPVPCDRSQSNEKDSTYCSVPFSCLSGRRKKVNIIWVAGTQIPNI